jgi:hypothetical protein
MDLNNNLPDRWKNLLPTGSKQIGGASWALIMGKISADDPRVRHLLKKRSKEKPVVYLASQVAVKDLASELGAKLHHVVKLLKEIQAFTGPNQRISFYTAAKIAKRYGFTAKRKIKAF